MLARVDSMGFVGIEGKPVTVEVDVSPGMPAYFLVGLPDAAVKESRERVQTALSNAGFRPPPGRVVVSLAPADMRKSGPCYDLPIAIATLIACGAIPQASVQGYAMMGELALDGSVNPITGVLPAVIAAREHGVKRFIVPTHNAREGACIPDVQILPAGNVREVVAHLRGENVIEPTVYTAADTPPAAPGNDLTDVSGQAFARRALEIAASGAHNLLFVGPPGAGKTMLARCLPGILPDMTFDESLEATRIHSISGLLPAGSGLLGVRPFRAPHHTASSAAMIGGGAAASPGEVSKANHGVLFLDELPEYPSAVKEALRQPLEDGVVTVARVGAQITYPARFMLIASMNPCPCGYYGSQAKRCRCKPGEIQRYLGRVSGPLLDRFDLHVEVEAMPVGDLSGMPPGESSAVVKARVSTARARQQARYCGEHIHANAQLTPALLKRFCALDRDARAFLDMAAERLSLSARAYTRVIKVARTIADLEGSERVTDEHLAEAVQYRGLDRKYWGSGGV